MKQCVQLVPLVEADLDFVKQTYNHYIVYSTAIFYLHPLNDTEVRQLVPVDDAHYPSFLIKADGIVCGFCYTARFKPKEAFDITAEITLYLAPSFTGRGIGREAMTLFEPHIRAAGIQNIIALITAENTGSLRLFATSGYTPCGYIRGVAQKFGRTLDLALYQKLL